VLAAVLAPGLLSRYAEHPNWGAVARLRVVWLRVYPLEERVQGVRRLLDVPDDGIPFAIVPVGHPVEPKPPADRYDPHRVRWEHW